MPGNHTDIEKRLWDAADELRANSKLKASEYSVPVLGLIFLRYADHKFSEAEKELTGAATGRRKIGKTDYQARGVLFLPEPARFSTLLQLTEGANLGKAINDAMKAIEEENEELRGILSKTYTALENATLVELLKLMASIPMDIEGDAFGKIYEYFLGERWRSMPHRPLAAVRIRRSGTRRSCVSTSSRRLRKRRRSVRSGASIQPIYRPRTASSACACSMTRWRPSSSTTSQSASTCCSPATSPRSTRPFCPIRQPARLPPFASCWR